jgi:hypothetical protein
VWNRIDFEGKQYQIVGGSFKTMHVNDIKEKSMFDYINKKLKEKLEGILGDGELGIRPLNKVRGSRQLHIDKTE